MLYVPVMGGLFSKAPPPPSPVKCKFGQSCYFPSSEHQLLSNDVILSLTSVVST